MAGRSIHPPRARAKLGHMDTVIDVSELRKRYGTTLAVDSITLSVRRGEVFGIVGPNGAGKTTTVECLEGLRQPDSGTVSVLGLDPRRQGDELRQRIGVQLQRAALPDRLKVWEALDLYASYYRHPVDWRPLVEEWGLSEKRTTAFADLSGGQQQRLFIALALVNDPEVVFLDELTTALDPQARLAMWDVVESVRDRGTTVVLTTHYMEEAEHLCDRVAIIDRGRLIALDRVPALVRDHAGGATARLTLTEPAPAELELASIDTVTAVQPAGKHLTVQGTGGFLQDVLTELTARDLRIADLRTTSPGLEDVFLNLTGRRMRGEAAS
jgi:ABC-2 type transport system ATP-binding protein